MKDRNGVDVYRGARVRVCSPYGEFRGWVRRFDADRTRCFVDNGNQDDSYPNHSLATWVRGKQLEVLR